MTDTTARLALPMIVPGQAQKEMTHNEALVRIDAAVQPNVVALGLATPPTDPDDGACWIVGDSASGAWSGHDQQLAIWTAAGWRFVAPTLGFAVWLAESGVSARFVDGAWEVGVARADTLILGGRAMLATPAAAIVGPGGGSIVDSGARSAIEAILAVLRHHKLVKTT